MDQLLAANRLQARLRPRTRRSWSEHVHGVVFGDADGFSRRMCDDPRSALLWARLEAATRPARNLRLSEDDLVHGDFGPVNVLVAGGRHCVIDTDRCGRGTRAIDLANLLTEGTVGRYWDPLGPDARRVRDECVAVVGVDGLRVCAVASLIELIAFGLDHSRKVGLYIARAHEFLDALSA